MADSPSELQFEIEKLERKHAEYPEGRFFVPLANAYRKVGDLDTAEALLRAGVERHPDYLSAHIVLGRCLADRGASDAAADEFRFVLTQDPQNLIALRTLGELAAAAGQTEEAAGWYRELLAVDPMNEDARQSLEALGDAPDSPEKETEFRSGAGWWEPAAPVGDRAGGEDDPGVAVPEEADDASPPVAEIEIPPAADLESPESTADPSEGTPPEEPRLDDVMVEGFESGDLTLAELDPIRAEASSPLPEIDAIIVDGQEFQPWSGFSDIADLETRASDIDEEDPPFEPDVRSSEVVTETIAELYARQGLFERAADVYRELIRRRGGDPALEHRLAEIERLAAGDLPEATPTIDSETTVEVEAAIEQEGVVEIEVEVEAEPAERFEPDLGIEGEIEADDLAAQEPFVEPWSAFGDPAPAPPIDDDPFAASFTAGFTDGEPTAEESHSAPIAGEQPDDTPLAPIAGEQPDDTPFAPIAGEQPDDTSFAAASAGNEYSAVHGDYAPITEEQTDAEWDDGEGAFDDAPLTIVSFLTGLATWQPGLGASSSLEPSGSTVTEAAPAPLPFLEEVVDGATDAATADEVFPWELPDGAVEAEVVEDLDSLPGESPEEDLPILDSSYIDPPLPVVETHPVESAPEAIQETPGPRGSQPAAQNEEDDLESFQAWLRSLKQ